ncbi:pilus assembly PilX N-terminal domain-containing protein [Legionella sainthelensi]|uniref:pilus assembly PilX N-terminal domain-containing protein n=1 Tax=Legionella sainthelensi TaxID=28087 RepID=UPI000E20655E|nr:pilus assembly PilX N-terminal domain-containing protein [Legionella sainthelensi]
MKKERGFIFTVTLLMIMVMSLLLLASMQHILLYYKIINRQEESHKNFYNLEHVARQLSEKYVAFFAPNCVIKEDSQNQILYKLLHHQGCALSNEGLQYEYLIEDLGDFPCLVARSENRIYATHHQRLSIVQLDKGKPLSFLQVRWIAVGKLAKCLVKEHVIPIGISSWCYLSLN